MLYLLACLAPPSPVEEGEGPIDTDRVVLNEVVVRNQSTWDDGASSFPDWVELYNAGPTPVDLSRLSLHDGAGVWHGEGGLQPGDRVLVPLGVDAPFRLGGGETLTLVGPDGVLDRLELGDPGPDVAWARHPDGGAWAETVWTTPDATNPDTPSPSLDPSERAFGPYKLHTVDIVLSSEAVASLLVERLAWVQGEVTLDGLRYGPVALRLKSEHGSRRELGEKPGWKIDLNEYADLRWHGQKGLTLNNVVQDPTYLREHLTYTLFRTLGIPAPRVGWASVTVNGEPYGVSVLVETVDDAFLGRWYDDPTGALYEGSYGVDLLPGHELDFEYDRGPDPDDRSDLTAVIDVLAGPADDAGMARLEGLVNVEALLTYLAAETLALHWDGYRNTNNYRLYHEPGGRLEMLPWGTDNTFGAMPVSPWVGRGILLRFCMTNPTCRGRFDARLVEVADRLDDLALVDELRDLDAWLRPAIAADPKREFEMYRHDVAIEETTWRLSSWPDEVRAQVAFWR
ncbi:MAG: CotH kinase family protein [Pseudomonadota bacterium]|nr:CotH kinase family protein [Pseudomonadota bacterium]